MTRITTVAFAALALAVAPHVLHAQKKESQADLMKEAKVTYAAAKSTALKKVPHSWVKNHEIERENGKLIYSIELKQKGKTGIEEVNIDAMTGDVVSEEHESPKKEAAEVKAEKKATTPAPAKH